jgi:phosphate transport system substrate-binding protein
VVLALLSAACGDDSDDGGDDETIEISGSSTVEPISALVASAFNEDNPDVGISVEGPGTGDGFARFCNGETDISDASRPIKDSEEQTCEANGVDFVELYIAIDGITVLTSPDNSAVACLDFSDMYALLGPESEGFATWADANDLAAELGAGNAPYPDADLVVTAPGEESGTYDTFVELVIEDTADQRGQEPASRADYEASPNDNVIINGISGNPTSLGWVGFAFFEENQDAVQAIAVDGGAGCVTPTTATIAGGDYPLSRPLYIYVNTSKAAAKASLASFVDYYLSDDGLTAVSEAGYVQLPAADIEETRSAWASR